MILHTAARSAAARLFSITAISSGADYEQTGFVGRHENDRNNMTPSLTTSLAYPKLSQVSRHFYATTKPDTTANDFKTRALHQSWSLSKMLYRHPWAGSQVTVRDRCRVRRVLHYMKCVSHSPQDKKHQGIRRGEWQ